MDGENNGKPYVQMDDLGYHYFWKHPYRISLIVFLNELNKGLRRPETLVSEGYS